MISTIYLSIILYLIFLLLTIYIGYKYYINERRKNIKRMFAYIIILALLNLLSPIIQVLLSNYSDTKIFMIILVILKGLVLIRLIQNTK